jgi:importin subunit beta-1
MLTRLEKSTAAGALSQDDVNRQNQLQGLLCGALQVLAQRLGDHIKPFCDSIMHQVLALFRSKRDSGVYEEGKSFPSPKLNLLGLLTVGAVANIVEQDFEKYMSELAQPLLSALQNSEEYQVCCVAVGLVGDISRALGPKMMPYCDRIITILLQNLQSRDLVVNALSLLMLFRSEV